MFTILAIIVIGFIARIYYVKNKIKSQQLKKIEFEKAIRQYCYKLGLTSDQVTSIAFNSTAMSQIDEKSIRYTSQGGKWFGSSRAYAVAMLIKEHNDDLHSKSVCVKFLKWAAEFNFQQISFVIDELENEINIHTIPPKHIKGIFALTVIHTAMWEELRLSKQLYLPEVIKDLPNLQHIYYGTDDPHHNFDIPIKNDFSLLNSCKNITKFSIYKLPSFDPSWIFDLKHIEYLDIYENGYDKIPEKIFDLQNLKELHICEKLIAEIPDSMGKLKQLHTISVSGAKLEYISPLTLTLDNLMCFECSVVDELKNSETLLKLRDNILARGGEFKVWLGTHA